VDDGSSDQTEELVMQWINKKEIQINYHYQENQGMHGAHNTAYELIETELNVCIDSDDYMPDNAVEKIVTYWEEHGSNQVAGIVGLDATFNGEIIGTRLPSHLETSNYMDIYFKHKVKGDKKLVYRTDLVRKVPPYPIFEGEKYCPLAYKYILIDQEGPLLLLNEVLCHVEYLEDGSSLNIIRQYKNNPRGFSSFRIVSMKYAISLKDRFRAAIHYVSSNIMSRNINYLIESPNKFITLLASPFGLALFLYLQRTKKVTVFKNT
jgi:glycosyltransferase involved in cell wall biosynthesis